MSGRGEPSSTEGNEVIVQVEGLVRGIVRMYPFAVGCIGVTADVPKPNPPHGTHGTHHLWENGKSGLFFSSAYWYLMFGC